MRLHEENLSKRNAIRLNELLSLCLQGVNKELAGGSIELGGHRCSDLSSMASFYRSDAIVLVRLAGGQGEEDLFERRAGSGLAAEFVQGAHRHQPTLVHDADFVGHFFRHAELVGGEKDGAALPGAFL